MQEYKLTGIYVYPIKSLGGIQLKEAIVESRGLQHDRRWMLVDESNRFMTQRTIPEMALIDVTIGNKGLMVSHRMNRVSSLDIPFDNKKPGAELVKIWGSTCLAREISKDANQWFSEVLNTRCKLVYMPDSTRREVEPGIIEDHIVSFADGFPFLVIGQNSLNDLNKRLQEPVSMNRFRPNLVFEGGEPYEEDHWKRFSMRNASFLAVKKCGRCSVPAVNQETGIPGNEPIQTMKAYRREGGKINFGVNAVCLMAGTIRTGETILLEQ